MSARDSKYPPITLPDAIYDLEARVKALETTIDNFAQLKKVEPKPVKATGPSFYELFSETQMDRIERMLKQLLESR